MSELIYLAVAFCALSSIGAVAVAYLTRRQAEAVGLDAQASRLESAQAEAMQIQELPTKDDEADEPPGPEPSSTYAAAPETMLASAELGSPSLRVPDDPEIQAIRQEISKLRERLDDYRLAPIISAGYSASEPRAYSELPLSRWGPVQFENPVDVTVGSVRVGDVTVGIGTEWRITTEHAQNVGLFGKNFDRILGSSVLVVTNWKGKTLRIHNTTEVLDLAKEAIASNERLLARRLFDLLLEKSSEPKIESEDSDTSENLKGAN